MNKLKLLFGLHSRQPVGKFEQVLAQHPRLKISLYYSGAIYDWLTANQPQFIEFLQKLVKRGQVEILSAAYYEPRLPLIPDEDKLGQLTMTKDFIREKFGREPRGLWISEESWEPSLPKILAKAGLEYALVDDSLFLSAGSLPPLSGYFLTEDEGEIIKVFPINGQLSALINSQPIDKIINFLKNIPNPDDNMAVIIFVDGEKLNNPDQLFSAFAANSAWLELLTFSDYLDECPGRGLVYLPTAEKNYARQILMRQPAANNLHKKMLSVSKKLQALSQGKTIFGRGKYEVELNKIKKYLYRGQCGEVFQSANLSLKRLRRGGYHNLIQAEKEIDKINHGNKPFVELAVTDINKDGCDEVVLANDFLSLYFAPARGGLLYELDYKPEADNLLDVVGWSGFLVDHFLGPGVSRNSFLQTVENAAAYFHQPRRREDEVSLRLIRSDAVNGWPVKIEKNISLLAKQALFVVEYEITNQAEEKNDFWLAVAGNFNLSANPPTAEENDVDRVTMVDDLKLFTVSLDFSRPALIWRLAHDQGLLAVSSWKFSLQPRENWRVKIILRVEQ
ncbi:DUF1926 domain-containing protein [Candidatus Saganbacteria bacterium]|nr:DUF1926 domain-containing protein [Candidatus Saganbacteria bacterium]